MPKKIRELKQILCKSGFTEIAGKGIPRTENYSCVTRIGWHTLVSVVLTTSHPSARTFVDLDRCHVLTMVMPSNNVPRSFFTVVVDYANDELECDDRQLDNLQRDIQLHWQTEKRCVVRTKVRYLENLMRLARYSPNRRTDQRI
ncbi:MAG: hypothetical protein HC778_05630, partial [Chamaesiphon sp. CSU_1_12]|nr:hypothetical protein [Chamaesiphon sp. CSU_1_12]